MADYNTLSLPQKINAALPGALAYYNVNNPPTTLDDRDNINRGIGAVDLGINVLRQQANLVGYDTPINVNENPELLAAIQPYIPAGYTVSTLTLSEIINVAEGVKADFIRIENSLGSGSPTIANGLSTTTTTAPPTNLKTTPQTTTSPGNSPQQSTTSKILQTAATIATVGAAVSAVSNLFSPRQNTNSGLTGQLNDTRAQASQQDATNFDQKQDWRVRLSLAPGAFYLYKDENNDLLAPLRKTDGIIFPYTPTINVTYGANYQSVAPVHSNYKIFQYENSFVDSITIACDFTAQDTEEANYVLAVIHFLRSVTKMFYGQDFNPKPGTPPPLCYLFGLGEFQFNAHPLAITNFTYNLPNDVDYIRAGQPTQSAGTSRADEANQFKPDTASSAASAFNMMVQRLMTGVAGVAGAFNQTLAPGGNTVGYKFGSSNRFNSPVPPGTTEPTYVPTKIQISISAVPIVSRYEISSEFSVENYANGTLLKGIQRPGGGIW